MNTYATSDLYLSAFLKAKGLRLIDKRRTGDKVVFIFDDRLDREDLIREFFNGGLVNITVFKSAMHDLKVMIFNM